MSVPPTSARTPTDPGARDVGGLYLELSPQLERIVRRTVCCSDAFVEDACQFAWSRLLRDREHVRDETALAWLTATAIHEAFKLSGRRARELSLDQALEDGLEPVSGTPEPCELLIQRERMGALRELPIRRQRVVWLRALGLSYREMAEYERCTMRTVERRLMTAQKTLRAREGATLRELAA